jgi:hypothetical protein
MGAELFRADRKTDMTKVIAAFRNFANEPKSFFSIELFEPLGFAGVLVFTMKKLREIQHNGQSVWHIGM